MRADIDQDGNLILTPETPMQRYALPKWMEDMRAGKVSVSMGGMSDVVPISKAPPEGAFFAAGDIRVYLGDDPCLAQRSIIVQMDSQADVTEAVKQGRVMWDPEAPLG